MKAGDTVRIAHTTLQGTILQRRIDEATDSVMYLVGYTDNNGEAQQRWCSAGELEAA